jgi:hypothetical protein
VSLPPRRLLISVWMTDPLTALSETKRNEWPPPGMGFIADFQGGFRVLGIHQSPAPEDVGPVREGVGRCSLVCSHAHAAATFADEPGVADLLADRGALTLVAVVGEVIPDARTTHVIHLA